MPSSPNYIRSPVAPVNFHGYLIYPNGAVYRPDMVRTRRDGVSRNIKGAWVHQRVRQAPKGVGGGYAYVDLWVDHTRVTWLVHRLVAVCFLGAPPAGAQVNHKDGDRTNNWEHNLEWVSASENQKHAYRTGVRGYNGCTAETAARIWEERNVKKRKLLDIADEFGVSFQSVSRIAKGGHHAIVT